MAGFVLVALIIGAAGCGEPRASEAEARTFAIDYFHGRTSLVTRSIAYRAAEEALPNVAFRLPSGREITAAHTVVVGTVTESRPGEGFVDAERGSKAVDFESSNADWKTVVLTLTIDDVLGTVGDEPVGDIEVGLAIGPGDEDLLQQGLQALGPIVMFLGPPGSFFGGRPGVYPVVEDGGLIGLIADDGTLSFPMRESAPGFLGAAPTIDALREAAENPRRVIELSGSDRVPARP